MNVHTIHEQPQQKSDNTNTISGEASQVNALLHIIETLQAQSKGLSEVQQRTIEELRGRVKQLTDKQSFLESELLAERQKSEELKKQQEAQERARLQQERARLEAARRVNEEMRKQLEAEKARKREELLDIQNNHYRDYSLAKKVFESITTGDKYYHSNSLVKWYPDDHFMEKIYKGTEIDIFGRTIHVYEIWRPTCQANHFQNIQSHFQNVMNHYKNLFDEIKRQRDAIV